MFGTKCGKAHQHSSFEMINFGLFSLTVNQILGLMNWNRSEHRRTTAQKSLRSAHILRFINKSFDNTSCFSYLLDRHLIHFPSLQSNFRFN